MRCAKLLVENWYKSVQSSSGNPVHIIWLSAKKFRVIVCGLQEVEALICKLLELPIWKSNLNFNTTQPSLD